MAGNRRCTMATYAVVLSGLAITAQAADIPGGAAPGRIEKRFETPALPQSQPEPVVPTEKQLPPNQSDKVHFTLRSLRIEGETVFSQDDLLSFGKDLLGTEVSLTQIYKLADAITAKYRNAGYILSTAIVPAQRISHGHVRIHVVEGYVHNVLVEGAVDGRAELFREYGERIKESRPLNVKVLERYSLLANDLPGVKAKAELRPSKDTPGASDVVFIVDHQYMNGTLSYDNRGSNTSGPREYTVGAELNSLLGLYEKTSVSWINTDQTEQLRYFTAEHDEILDSEGTILALTGNMSHGQPGGTLYSLDTRTRNVTAGATLSHPFIRTRNETWKMFIGFTLRDSKTDELGSTLSDDHTRSFNIGTSYDFSDSWQGANLISVTVSRGIYGLGATADNSTLKSRANGQAGFTKVTFDASRNQQLPDNFSVLLAVTGQYSANTLLVAEQFGYGGSSFGRGYDASEITGDSGGAAKVELQYTNKSDALKLKYYQPFIYYDFGVTNDRDPINTDATRSGASAGGGIRFAITDYFSGSIEIDRPLTRPVAAELSEGKGKSPRAFFSFTARY